MDAPAPAALLGLGLAVVNATASAAEAAFSRGADVGAVVTAGMSVLASVAASNAVAGTPDAPANSMPLLAAAATLLNASSSAGAQLPQGAASATLALLGSFNMGGVGEGVGAGAASGPAAVLTALTAAALASPSAAAGAPQSFSSAPAVAPGAPLCAPAVALTVFRVPVGSISASRGGNWSLSIGAPLPFCNASVALPEVGGVLPARPLQLPRALVAAQPPPTLTLSFATLAWLTRAGGPVAAAGAASVDFRLVQWGAPPMSEHSGLGGIVYPPAAEAEVPVDSGGGGARRRALAAGGARSLGFLSGFSAFFSPSAWAGMVSSAFSATRAQLQATSPSPPRADRLPSRPMDSRVFSIEVSSGGGPPRPLSSIPGGPPGGLFYITVPLRDLSIVNYGPGGAAGVEVGQSLLARSPVINATCPFSGTARVGAVVAALNVAAAPPAPVNVVIASVGTVPLSAPSLDVATPAGGAEEDGLAGGGGGGGEGGGGGGGDAAISPAGGEAGLLDAPTFLLVADCGAPYGNRTFACGPGMGGTTVSFACPKAAPVPSCLHYDKGSKSWTTEGCAVARVDLTSVLCACDHLADFGTRFAALDDAPLRVFVTAAPNVQFYLLSSAGLLFGVLAAVLCAMGAGGLAARGASGERGARAALLSALRADAEVVLLGRLGAWSEAAPRRFGASAAAVAPHPAKPPASAEHPLGSATDADDNGARDALLRLAKGWLWAGAVATPPLRGPLGASSGLALPPAAAPLRPWAEALRFSATSAAAGAGSTAPGASPPPAPSVSDVAALSLARLRAGAHGPALFHVAALPAACAGRRGGGGGGGALLGHALLLGLGVTAALYAKVFGRLSTAVVSLRPPLAPIGGGALVALAFASAAALGVLLGALMWLRAESAAAALRLQFPALAAEDELRRAFSVAVRGAGSDWASLREGALVLDARVREREPPPPSLAERLAAHAGWAVTWGASAFSVYYCVSFGVRNGAAPANALVGAAALAAALRFALLQPSWATLDAAAALSWRAFSAGVAEAAVPPLLPALVARATAAAACAGGGDARARLDAGDAVLSAACWGWAGGPAALLLHAARGNPLLVPAPEGAALSLALPSLYLALRLELLLSSGVEALLPGDREGDAELAQAALKGAPISSSLDSAALAPTTSSLGGGGSGPSNPATSSRAGTPSAPLLPSGSGASSFPAAAAAVASLGQRATGSKPMLPAQADALSAIIAAAPRPPRLPPPVRPFSSASAVALRAALPARPLLPPLKRAQQIWSERARFEGAAGPRGGGPRGGMFFPAPPAPSALAFAGGAALSPTSGAANMRALGKHRAGVVMAPPPPPRGFAPLRRAP